MPDVRGERTGSIHRCQRSRGVATGDELDAFLETTDIELVPVTAKHFIAARRAWQRLGKGNHSASLSFGDCFAYALAEATGEPLLFKGDDFAHTDIASALTK